jgi:membrane protease YdiL (CAAX protease family)
MFALLFLQFIMGIAVMVPSIILKEAFKSPELAMNIQNYGIPAVTLLTSLAMGAALLWLSKRPLSTLWQRGSFQVSILPLLVILILGVSIIESELDNLTRYFFPMPDLIRNLMESMNPTPLSGMFLLVIVAPFGEEVLFRGGVMGGFLKRYSWKKAILASAAIFALAHVNPYQLFSAFTAGLMMGTIYLKTRSLWPCVFMHGVNNLMCWAMMNKLSPVEIPGYTTPPTNETFFQPWWFDLMGVALTIVAIWALVWYFKRQGRKESQAAVPAPEPML